MYVYVILLKLCVRSFFSFFQLDLWNYFIIFCTLRDSSNNKSGHNKYPYTVISVVLIQVVFEPASFVTSPISSLFIYCLIYPRKSGSTFIPHAQKLWWRLEYYTVRQWPRVSSLIVNHECYTGLQWPKSEFFNCKLWILYCTTMVLTLLWRSRRKLTKRNYFYS